MNKELVKKHILNNEEIYVNIVDEVMGRGKTSSAINFINESSDDTHFLYITPYLSEVDRITRDCPNKNFKQPEKKISKLKSIKELFDKKENIVSTHALFRYFDEEIIDIAYANNYILIMDEVAEVIEQYYITKDDLKDILTNYAHVDPDTRLLVWDYKEYTGAFDNIKKLCELKSITVYNDTAMLWLFPITTFRAFRETYVLTYMFSAQTQRYYYDYYHINYKRLYVKYEDGKYQFTNEPVNIKCKYDYRNLIKICENEKLNEIGLKQNTFSWTWYERNKDNSIMNQIKKNTQNYFRNILKAPSNTIIWTTFKDFQSKISGQGYAKSFVPSNMRAINEYMDRDNVAYLVNKYFNPYIKQFFISHNIEVEEDNYAISEMLQFIWRSAIRNGKPINLYIPSKRMRDLLKQWIDSQEYEDSYDNEEIEDKNNILKFSGDFYFGFNSVPFEQDGVIQIKCIKKIMGGKLEIITLQLNFNNELIECIKSMSYIIHSNIEYIKLSSTLYQVVKITSIEDVTPNKYNGKLIGDIQVRLRSMKKQEKLKKCKGD